MNTYLVVTSLLNLLSSVLLTAFVLSARGQTTIGRRFVWFLASISVWTLAYALWQLSESETAALQFSKMLTVAIFIPVTFYHLSLAIAESERRLMLYAGYAVGVAGMLVAPTDLMVSGVSDKLGYRFWPDAGPLYILVIGMFVLYVPLSLGLLFMKARRRVGAFSSRMLFVATSFIIGFAGGATNFPLWYDIPIPPIGNGLIFIYLSLVGYGIYFQRIGGINVDVFKGGVFLLINGSVAFFVTVFAAVLKSVAGEAPTGGELWRFGFAAFVVSVLIFWGVPRFKAHAEAILDRAFRREHLSSLEKLRELPQNLSDRADQGEMVGFVVDELQRILGLSPVDAYIREPFGEDYTRFGVSPDPDGGPVFRGNSPVVRRLQQNPQVITLDAIQIEISPELENAYIECRQAYGYSVYVPVFAGGYLYGFLAAGNPEGRGPVSDEEASILFAIGSQLGLNVKAREIERRSNDMQRLLSLGTMAAGLAHELRNPLVSVKTFAAMVESGRLEQLTRGGFNEVLKRDIKRIVGIVEGVAVFSNNRDAAFTRFDLRDSIDQAMEICAKPVENGHVRVIRSTPDPVLIQGNLDQIVQVFVNLIENAVHAVRGRENPEIRIEASRRAHDGTRSRVNITVADNGCGVPAHMKARIFDPFFTSKDTGAREASEGMGLGLAISKQIIDSHGADIVIRDNQPSGSVFVLSFTN